MTRLVVADRRTALTFGVLSVGLGAWLLHQAYEARGRRRPLWANLLTTV